MPGPLRLPPLLRPFLPAGALTSKPYAFTARAWELKHTDSLDVFDAVGSNLKLGSRGSSILRVLPRVNERVNEEWITDKARFSYDALKFQRILHCYKHMWLNTRRRPRPAPVGSFLVVDWPAVFGLLLPSGAQHGHSRSGSDFWPHRRRSRPTTFSFLVGSFCDLETLALVSVFGRRLAGRGGLANSALPAGLELDLRSSFLSEPLPAPLGGPGASLLLVGCNPRLEAPALHLQLRRAVLGTGLRVWSFGFRSELGYPCRGLGPNLGGLALLLEARSAYARQRAAAGPHLVLYGTSLLQQPAGAALSAQLGRLLAPARLLPAEASTPNYAERADARPSPWARPRGPRWQWLSDEDKSSFPVSAPAPSSSSVFRLYVGHHGDLGFAASSLVLPTTLFAEKNSTYLNYQGHFQKTRALASSVPPGAVRDERVLLATLLAGAGAPAGSGRGQLPALAPTPAATPGLGLARPRPSPFYLARHNLYFYMKDFYRNDSISRNSPVLALTSHRLNHRRSSFSA